MNAHRSKLDRERRSHSSSVAFLSSLLLMAAVCFLPLWLLTKHPVSHLVDKRRLCLSLVSLMPRHALPAEKKVKL